MAEITDIELAQAKQRWDTERAERPVPASVRYDHVSERIVVEFTNGACFLFPTRNVEGLQDATADQLAEVELLGETGLHWESLDIDYSISGLLSGIFGSRTFIAAQREATGEPTDAAASRGPMPRRRQAVQTARKVAGRKSRPESVGRQFSSGAAPYWWNRRRFPICWKTRRIRCPNSSAIFSRFSS
jgi:hypothetical protein